MVHQCINPCRKVHMLHNTEHYSTNYGPQEPTQAVLHVTCSTARPKRFNEWRVALSTLGHTEQNISVESAHWLVPSALWQTRNYWLNRFDTRNMIGWSAGATTDLKVGLPVVEKGIICFYYEGPPLGRREIYEACNLIVKSTSAF